MTPRRFHRLRQVLDRRQPDLTVVLENVHKPHNLSAIVRTCDAVGVFEAHAVTPDGTLDLVDAVAQGTRRWMRLRTHPTLYEAFDLLRERGFRILAAHLEPRAVDYREIDYRRPTAVLLGQEKDGVTAEAAARADDLVAIPMLGMVTSLNVSVAAALLLFEAQRQRAAAGLYGRRRLDDETYRHTLFEWAYPGLAELCRREGLPYPPLGEDGEILGPVPRGAG
jgi:tRNA (guanosine-2'-O-)-methyltransferase